MLQSTVKTCVFGASPSTGNQGVNALCWSTLEGLASRGCAETHVFEYGTATGSARFGELCYTLHGVTVGKRLWRSNHLGVARLAALVGLRRHQLVDTVQDADLVLDVSGGDSFTDLYGSARFRNIVAPKQIALSLGRRLVLLPQTYGPFTREKNQRIAKRLIAGATLAYARDPDSFARLQALLGEQFDPARHRQGVDLAFGLQPRRPHALDINLATALLARCDRPIIGLNISGLIANRPREAVDRFGLNCDYLSMMRELIVRLLEETDAQLLIVPHVHAPAGHYESDLEASQYVLDSLPEPYRREADERATVVTGDLDACELKWIISQCEWFCGTRMHATIAALSSGVPTAALAYSLKTRGVFETCGVAECVVDLRKCTHVEALERIMCTWHLRHQMVATLERNLPMVRVQAKRQMDEIAACARNPESVERALHC
jgi:polysaccharide pyruvyl transferase WcaK-like protein